MNYIFVHLLDNKVFNSRLYLTDSLNCRDVTLANILLDEGHYKLADFGLAAVGVFQRMALSSAHGTECYCAPEVIFVFTFPYDLFIFC